MIKRNTIRFFLGLIVVMVLGINHPVNAASQDTTNTYIIQLIDSIRKDPLAYAEQLGYDRDVFVKALPWLVGFSQDLEPLVGVEYLARKATHLNDNGAISEAPVPGLGWDYAYTGEIGGVISFDNFISSEAVVNVVINDQLTKELDPWFEGKRLILSKTYTRIGTAFRGGGSQESQYNNAYFMTVCFGSSQLRSEIQIVNMINQIREKTASFNWYLAYNTSFLTGGWQPLFLNKPLQSVALTGLVFDINFAQWAEQFEFGGAGVLESSMVESYPKSQRDLQALWAFYSLALNEAKLYPEKQAIFNSGHNEIGAAVYFVSGVSSDSMKLTLASGIKENSDKDKSRIYGIIFSDMDKDFTYTPGEGIGDRVVTAFNKLTLEPVSKVITNNAGQFTMTLPRNEAYIIQAMDGQGIGQKDIYLGSDQYFDMDVN